MTATLNSELPTTAAQQNQTYAPAYPHGKIEQLFWDIFWVQGSIRVGPGMSMNRNMVIIRNRHELTLINPVRLNETEERKLEKLGRVTHVFRLGDFHGLDDQYYVDKYQARFWVSAWPKHLQSTACECASENRPGHALPSCRVVYFRQRPIPGSGFAVNQAQMSAHHRLAAIPG